MLAVKAEFFAADRGFEDRHLLLEDLAVVHVVGITSPANIYPERIGFARFGPTAQPAQQAATREHVGERVVFGESHRVPRSQDVHQRAEANAPGSLGEDRIQQDHVGHDLEAVVLEVVLGCPHRVEAQLVGALGIGGQVTVDATIVCLAIAALVSGRSLDARIGHVDRAEEERSEFQLDLLACACRSRGYRLHVMCRSPISH